MKIKRKKLYAEYWAVKTPFVELHNREFSGTHIEIRWCEHCFPRKPKKKQ